VHAGLALFTTLLHYVISRWMRACRSSLENRSTSEIAESAAAAAAVAPCSIRQSVGRSELILLYTLKSAFVHHSILFTATNFTT